MCGCATGVNGRQSSASSLIVILIRRSLTWLARRIYRGPSLEKIKAIEVDEFSYFQLHLALKAPVRYALFEADDAAVGQAMNINMGPEKPADLDAMWQEIRAR